MKDRRSPTSRSVLAASLQMAIFVAAKAAVDRRRAQTAT
jgi:hypothetical protein